MNKRFLLLLILSLSFNAFGHGGDDGPSSLENEFSKLSHIHLPVNYSTHMGLSLGYELGGHEEEAEHDDHEGEDTHGDEIGLELDIHPVMFGGQDKIKRLINLDEVSGSNTLELSDENSSYLLLENRKWDLGLGIEGDFHLPLTGLSAGVGISFLRGKNYYSVKTLTHKKEIREDLSLPLKKEDLTNWRVGDMISYATKGSIILNAFVGVEPFIHMGPEYIHTGTYRIKILLETEDTLEVEVQTTSTHSIGFEGNALITGAEVNKSKGHARSITYEFNLSKMTSLKALEYLFNGRMDLTNQEMLISGGAIILNTKTNNSGFSYSGSFGLPVLFIRGMGRGVYHSYGTMEENEDGENHVSEIYTTAAVSERFTRGRLSNHKSTYQSLVSTIIRGEHALISSVLSWSFSADKVTAGMLQKNLRKLANIFNAPDLEDLRIPDIKNGYVKTDFNLNLSGADLLHLLNLKEMNKVEENALVLLKEDFKQYGHRSFCRIRTYNNCLKRYKNLIQSKYQKIRLTVTNLDGAYKKENMRTVSSQLNSLVKTLFSSRYLTQSFSLLRKPKREIRFEGEYIKKQVISQI